MIENDDVEISSDGYSYDNMPASAGGGSFLDPMRGSSVQCVELRVSHEALQWTLRKQLFRGSDGCIYLKSNASSPLLDLTLGKLVDVDDS
jgi:hypothetical protein